MGYLIILVALFALLWVLLIRPQRKRSEAQLAMQDRLRAGEEVITAGGLHGVVKAIEDDVLHLEIAPGTLVRVDRRAIAAIVSEEESEPEGETGADADGEPVSPGEG